MVQQALGRAEARATLRLFTLAWLSAPAVALTGEGRVWS